MAGWLANFLAVCFQLETGCWLANSKGLIGWLAALAEGIMTGHQQLATGWLILWLDDGNYRLADWLAGCGQKGTDWPTLWLAGWLAGGLWTVGEWLTGWPWVVLDHPEVSRSRHFPPSAGLSQHWQVITGGGSGSGGTVWIYNSITYNMRVSLSVLHHWFTTDSPLFLQYFTPLLD